MSRKQRILAAILVFAALGYLFAYTLFSHPYFASGASDESNEGAKQVSSKADFFIRSIK